MMPHKAEFRSLSTPYLHRSNALTSRHNPSYGEIKAWFTTQPLHTQVGTVAVVVGGAAGLVLGTRAIIRRLRRPKPFARLAPQCNEFEFADRQVRNDAIIPIIRRAGKTMDPFEITKEFVREYAPDCSPWPAPRSPGEAELYAKSFMDVLRVMEDENLLNHAQKAMYAAMIAVWASHQQVREVPPVLGSTTVPTQDSQVGIDQVSV